MSGTHYRDDQQLALAVARSIEDEDFTLAVIVPVGTDEEAVLDRCLAASSAIEDEMDLYILPRVQSESC